ncbi:MAG: hypothetical protein ACQEWF_10695 [Bacillota bacterium]
MAATMVFMLLKASAITMMVIFFMTFTIMFIVYFKTFHFFFIEFSSSSWLVANIMVIIA